MWLIYMCYMCYTFKCIHVHCNLYFEAFSFFHVFLFHSTFLFYCWARIAQGAITSRGCVNWGHRNWRREEFWYQFCSVFESSIRNRRGYWACWLSFWLRTKDLWQDWDGTTASSWKEFFPLPQITILWKWQNFMKYGSKLLKICSYTTNSSHIWNSVRKCARYTINRKRAKISSYQRILPKKYKYFHRIMR